MHSKNESGSSNPQHELTNLLTIKFAFGPSAHSRPKKSYDRDLLDLGEHLGPKPLFGSFSKNMTSDFWKESQKQTFLKNGSPGQTTLLDRSGSNFCVEPRSQNPDISYMSQNPI